MSFFSNIFGRKKESTESRFTDDEIQTVTLMAQRLTDIINESLNLANDSKKLDTKLSRLAVAKEKLESIKELAEKYPFIVLTKLTDVERTILSLELEFEQLVEANLEKEVQARESVEYKHHDLELMKQRCEYELASMRKNGEVAAPYFFERVAILSRKLKNYEQEVLYCEMYISELDRFYAEKALKIELM